MRLARIVLVPFLALAGQLAPAGEEPPLAECTPAEDAAHVARVRLEGPTGAPIGAASIVVEYPTASLVVPGTGSAVPADTRVEGPVGAMLAVSDADGALRIVVANPKGMEGEVVVRVRLRRCRGADAPAEDALRCRVLDASDDHANVLRDLGCSVVFE